MKYHKDLDFFRAILMCLVILIHIVNFGDIYPSTKSAILSFMMPTFLVITGFLVNIDKSVKDFLRYIWQIALPYTIFVVGYAAMSLYLPVRDGIKVFDIATISDILLVKSIGPYWFFHVMIVCGVIYYVTFHFLPKINITAKIFAFCCCTYHCLTMDTVLKYQDGCLLFYRSRDQAVCRWFLADIQKKFLADNSFWLIDYSNRLSRLGCNIDPDMRLLVPMFFFVFLLFSTRTSRSGSSIYRTQHLSYLHFSPDIYDDVEVLVASFQIWALGNIACTFYHLDKYCWKYLYC